MNDGRSRAKRALAMGAVRVTMLTGEEVVANEGRKLED